MNQDLADRQWLERLELDIHQRLELAALRFQDLLGDQDIIDSYLLDRLLTARAQQYAHQLTSDDPKLAAQTAIDLAELVDLYDADAAASPLGIAVAMTFEYQTLTKADTARLLKVTHQRVTGLIKDGKLEVTPSGRVLRSSIARWMKEKRPHVAASTRPPRDRKVEPKT